MAAHRPGRSRRARRPAGRPAGELRGGPPQHRRRADRLSGPDPDQPRDSRWIVQAESDIAAGHDRCPRPARAAFAGPGLARRRPQLLDAPARAGGDGKAAGLAAGPPPCGEPVPPMGDGDSVIFFNFRPDRARQLSHAILDASWDPFPRAHRPALAHFVTFTEYEKGLPAEVAFPDEPLTGVLAEVISSAGWRQFHTAETEKYAHVTYFLNGGREAPFEGEDRLLVPSPKVATYDLEPAMSARPVTDVLLDRLATGRYRFLVVNFANPDMVGHTGVFPATVEAVEVVDAMLGRIGEAVLAGKGILAVTADHGNAELKVDAKTGAPLTAHTTSPVPFILGGAPGVQRLREAGKLGDIAPTILPLVGLRPPPEMTGDDLRC